MADDDFNSNEEWALEKIIKFFLTDRCGFQDIMVAGYILHTRNECGMNTGSRASLLSRFASEAKDKGGIVNKTFDYVQEWFSQIHKQVANSVLISTIVKEHLQAHEFEFRDVIQHLKTYSEKMHKNGFSAAQRAFAFNGSFKQDFCDWISFLSADININSFRSENCTWKSLLLLVKTSKELERAEEATELATALTKPGGGFYSNRNNYNRRGNRGGNRYNKNNRRRYGNVSLIQAEYVKLHQFVRDHPNCGVSSQTIVNDKTCVFFQNGNCRKGNNCSFKNSHACLSCGHPSHGLVKCRNLQGNKSTPTTQKEDKKEEDKDK